jgi:hypothetical protein
MAPMGGVVAKSQRANASASGSVGRPVKPASKPAEPGAPVIAGANLYALFANFSVKRRTFIVHAVRYRLS